MAVEQAAYREYKEMLKKTLLVIAVIAVLFSLLGCNTARGLKEDVTFIGDKTLEVLDKDD